MERKAKIEMDRLGNMLLERQKTIEMITQRIDMDSKVGIKKNRPGSGFREGQKKNWCGQAKNK